MFVRVRTISGRLLKPPMASSVWVPPSMVPVCSPRSIHPHGISLGNAVHRRNRQFWWVCFEVFSLFPPSDYETSLKIGEMGSSSKAHCSMFPKTWRLPASPPPTSPHCVMSSFARGKMGFVNLRRASTAALYAEPVQAYHALNVRRHRNTGSR